MDPLSIIASTVAISQVLGFGLQRLQSLRNTSAEYSDMLDELSNLQGSLCQLDSLMQSIAADPSRPTAISPDAVNQLETVKIDLDLIVGEMNEMTARLLSRGWRHLGRAGKLKVSHVHWQLKSRKVIRLKERAARCRENLMTCLALFGLSQR